MSYQRSRFLSRFLTLFLFGMALSLLGGCSGGARPQRAPDLALTPQAGGMVLPAPQPAQMADGGPDLAPAVLSVGQTVAATGERPLRLQAAASAGAPVLDVYPPGAVFTVIEPSGSYTGYPVQVEGRTWYRLQASDGLVGWVLIDEITAQQVDP
jgi:hypothetical protein